MGAKMPMSSLYCSLRRRIKSSVGERSSSKIWQMANEFLANSIYKLTQVDGSHHFTDHAFDLIFLGCPKLRYDFLQYLLLPLLIPCIVQSGKSFFATNEVEQILLRNLCGLKLNVRLPIQCTNYIRQDQFSTLEPAQQLEFGQGNGHLRFVLVIWIILRILLVKKLGLFLKIGRIFSQLCSTITLLGCDLSESGFSMESTLNMNCKLLPSCVPRTFGLFLMCSESGVLVFSLLSSNKVDGPFGCVPTHNWKSFRCLKFAMMWLTSA